MKYTFISFRNTSLCLVVLALGGCAHSDRLAVDPMATGLTPDARALAKDVAAKLEAAKTIRLTAKHKIDPSIGVGSKIEDGPLVITMSRPNRFHAVQSAGRDTREISYDGRTLCVMHPELKHHAIGSVRASSIEDFSDRVDSKFGFRPPLAELLANDLVANLFRDVTSASVVGTERVGFTTCQRLHTAQDGMTTDLWIGVEDRLPHRILFTFSDMADHPTWDIRLKKWELSVPVDESLFAKRPAADSMKVQMVKSR